jgi:hypothetical protein
MRKHGKHRTAVTPANLGGVACTTKTDDGITVDRAFAVRVHHAVTVAQQTGTPLSELLPVVCGAVNNAGLPVLADPTDVERAITYLEDLPEGNKFRIVLNDGELAGV